MPSRTDRNDFGPPGDSGRLRAFGWALLVHALLIGALTWGVNWKRSDTSPSFSAELWSSTAQEAAPRANAPLAAPAPPPPLPPPTPLATPKPSPPVVAAPTPAPRAPDVDIAVEEEKKRKLLKQKLAREEEDKQDKRQAAMDAKAEKVEREQAQARRLADDTKKQVAAKLEATKNEAAKIEAAKVSAAALTAKNRAAAAADAAADAAAVEDQRKKNLARTLGMAGASGDDASKGTAKVSSGPSASYGGKVRAKVKPNIVFTDAVDENVKAEVEVRSALDGTITSQRLVKSSGNKAWDDAVIKAIVRTETMPRDTDGRVPPLMILEFRPRD